MSKIKSLPGQRLCSQSAPGSRPLGNERRHPAPTDTVRRPRSPAPSRRWSWRCTSTRQGTIFIFPASRNLGRTYMLRELSSPASARPRRRRTCFTSTISMIRIVPCCCPSRRGRAKSCVRCLFEALADIRKELPVRLDNEKYVKKRSGIAGSFSGRAFRAHQADGQDRPGEEGFNLDMDEQGSLTLYPLVEGKRLSEDEYEHLDPHLASGTASRRAIPSCGPCPAWCAS